MLARMRGARARAACVCAALILGCASGFRADNFERPVRGNGGVRGCKGVGQRAMGYLRMPHHSTAISTMLDDISLEGVPLPFLPTLLKLVPGWTPGQDTTLKLGSRFQMQGESESDMAKFVGDGKLRGELMGRFRTSLPMPSGGEAGLQLWGVTDTEGKGQGHVTLLPSPTTKLAAHITSLAPLDLPMPFSCVGEVWHATRGSISAEYADGRLTGTLHKRLHSPKTHLFAMLSQNPGRVGGRGGGLSVGVAGAVTNLAAAAGMGKGRAKFEQPSVVAQYSSDALEFSAVFANDMEDYSLSFSHAVVERLTVAGEVKKARGDARVSSLAAIADVGDNTQVRAVLQSEGCVGAEIVQSLSPTLSYRICATAQAEQAGPTGGLRLVGKPSFSLSFNARG